MTYILQCLQVVFAHVQFLERREEMANTLNLSGTPISIYTNMSLAFNLLPAELRVVQKERRQPREWMSHSINRV